MAKLDFIFDATKYQPTPPVSEPPQEVPWEHLSTIDEKNPTEESVLAYLHARQQALVAQGLQCIPVEQFYTQEALAAWRVLWAEIPAGQTPAKLMDLNIKCILARALQPFFCTQSGKHIVTLMDYVERGRMLFDLWLDVRDDDTPEKKRARLNRDAQRRYRLRMSKRDSPEAQHARAVKEAYEKYAEACRLRKQEMARWDEWVNSVKQAWLDMKARDPKQTL